MNSKTHGGQHSRVRFEVIRADATSVPGDVLALKYAQAPYGLDARVSKLLEGAGVPTDQRTPRQGGFRLLPAPAGVEASRILLVGVEQLWSFGYEQIRVFARKVLISLAGECPDARRLIVTVHGPGYGLDESEAFASEVAGFLDAIASSDVPEQLERITFAERNAGRAERLAALLDQLLRERDVRVGQTFAESADPRERERLAEVGFASAEKPHAFVAMPFADKMDDWR